MPYKIVVRFLAFVFSFFCLLLIFGIKSSVAATCIPFSQAPICDTVKTSSAFTCVNNVSKVFVGECSPPNSDWSLQQPRYCKCDYSATDYYCDGQHYWVYVPTSSYITTGINQCNPKTSESYSSCTDSDITCDQCCKQGWSPVVIPTPTPTLACPEVSTSCRTAGGIDVSWNTVTGGDLYQVIRDDTLTVWQGYASSAADVNASCGVQHFYDVNVYSDTRPDRECEQNAARTCVCPTPIPTSTPTNTPTPTSTPTPVNRAPSATSLIVTTSNGTVVEVE